MPISRPAGRRVNTRPGDAHSLTKSAPTVLFHIGGLLECAAQRRPPPTSRAAPQRYSPVAGLCKRRLALERNKNAPVETISTGAQGVN